jgi:hypothetical protein
MAMGEAAIISVTTSMKAPVPQIAAFSMAASSPALVVTLAVYQSVHPKTPGNC